MTAMKISSLPPGAGRLHHQPPRNAESLAKPGTSSSEQPGPLRLANSSPAGSGRLCSRPAHHPVAAPTAPAATAANAVATTHLSASAWGIQEKDTNRNNHRQIPKAPTVEATAISHRAGTSHRTERATPPPLGYLSKTPTTGTA